MRNTEKPPANTVQSVVRAARIVEALADAGRPLSLSQVADAVGVGLPTAYRFMQTLDHLQWVVRDPELKQYRIAPRMVRFAHSFFETSDLWPIAHPHLVQARQEYNETFNLAVLDGTDILYIDRVKTRRILDIRLDIGSKLPAFCTAMGRVLLAALPSDEAHRRLARTRREPFTPKTVTEMKALMAALETARRRGFAVNQGEIAGELVSVSAPVHDVDGRVVAALNMAVRAEDYDQQAIEATLVPIVTTVAARISRALGYNLPV